MHNVARRRRLCPDAMDVKPQGGAHRSSELGSSLLLCFLNANPLAQAMASTSRACLVYVLSLPYQFLATYNILVLIWLVAKILVVYGILPTLLASLYKICQLFDQYGVKKSSSNILASQWLLIFWSGKG
jgi:hypothetical protein